MGRGVSSKRPPAIHPAGNPARNRENMTASNNAAACLSPPAAEAAAFRSASQRPLRKKPYRAPSSPA
ncbi:hypothetical protein MTHERMOG20_23990 [Moorella thermoacetica]|nr:hypothetical protein MTHERMOG20_23990 [Moorella thermoacetica]